MGSTGRLPLSPGNPNTVSSLHTDLQVANFQRDRCAFTWPIMYVSSRVWYTLSHEHIFHKWFCFCVLYWTVLYSIFILSLDVQKCKTSSDVAGTTVLFKVPYHMIKNGLLCVCLLCIIGVKSIANLLQCSTT